MSQKRKREEDEEEVEETTPEKKQDIKIEERVIHLSNISTFYVGYDCYQTHYEHILKNFPNDCKWWTNHELVKYRPIKNERCIAMDFDERLIWRCLNADMHVLLSGKAGAGKSFLLKKFVENADNSKLRIALTAYTAVAANNIGGETIHKKLGLGLASESPDELWATCQTHKGKRALNFLKETDILIIDEISMVQPELFIKLEYLFRKARKNENLFGGLKLVMVGDFAQLGPISKPNETTSVIYTDVWKSMNLARIFLVRNFRQDNTDPLFEILNEIREGRLSEPSAALLRSRINADLKIRQEVNDNEQTKTEFMDLKEYQKWKEENNEEEEKKKKKIVLEIKPLEIYPHNKKVDQSNKTSLKELVDNGAYSQTFPPFVRPEKRDSVDKMKKDEEDKAKDYIKKNFVKLPELFPVFNVELAIGAQVMMRCNQYMDEGIFNGSIGIVTAIETNFISVIFMKPGKNELNNTPKLIGRYDFKHRFEKTVDLVLRQFPLSLAYAATIHKVQGLTLNNIQISIRNCFENAQAYVALSRVGKLQNIVLIDDFDPHSIMVDKQLVDFESLPDPTLFSLSKWKESMNQYKTKYTKNDEEREKTFYQYLDSQQNNEMILHSQKDSVIAEYLKECHFSKNFQISLPVKQWKLVCKKPIIIKMENMMKDLDDTLLFKNVDQLQEFYHENRVLIPFWFCWMPF